jgi:phosphatidylserine/phosphatidylglycerophosphate/cardiolipin synthase-like enzyme
MKNIIASLLIVSLFIATGCTTLKYSPSSTPEVHSLPPANSGVLREVSWKFAQTHPAQDSGLMLLTPNDDAFRWRLALIDHATTSIDAQYFIWQDDETGILLFDRLLKAADRGVRVRLLVDDLVFAAKDREIAAFCRHPNFDIKIFNPGMVRDSTLGKLGVFLLYFKEMNRRMHNKLLAVDNRLKAMVSDRERCFIGSLNIDPRALDLNTENGLYIESAGLCGQLADQFENLMSAENAWHVYLNADNQLRWQSSSGTVSTQPARSFWQRIADFFWRLMPIESQI